MPHSSNEHDVIALNDPVERDHLLSLAVHEAGQAVLITDARGRIRYVNPAFTAITGYESAEVIGKSPSVLKSGLMEMSYYNRLWNTIIAGRHWQEIIINRRKNGTLYHALQIIAPITGASGTVTGYVAIQTDVTEQQRLTDALRAAERRSHELNVRLSSIIESFDDLVFILDRQGRFVEVYPGSGASALFADPASFIGRHYGEIGFPPAVVDATDRAMADLAASGTAQQFDYALQIGDVERWFSSKLTMLRDRDGVFSGVTVVSRDITDRKNREKEIERLSVTDHLTRCYNRAHFSRVLGEEIHRARRYETILTLIMFDIDHFKVINDTHGHDAGDRALLAVADIARSLIRMNDTFARWGGEEFMVLTPHTSTEGALIIAERIRQSVASGDLGGGLRATVSLGISELVADDTATGDGFIKRADEALYDAKNSGRNRIAIRPVIRPESH